MKRLISITLLALALTTGTYLNASSQCPSVPSSWHYIETRTSQDSNYFVVTDVYREGAKTMVWNKKTGAFDCYLSGSY